MPTILTKDPNDPRYSFNRIDDDLCEVLLSYLSLDLKFRFECVSKQFQRCVYEKQKQFKLDFKLTNKMKRTDLLSNKYIDLQLIEQILTKCPNINQVFIETMTTQSETNYQQMIELIINNCKYLSAIDFFVNVSDNNQEIYRKLFTKFGPKMRKIGFNRDSHLDDSYLKLCKNLREINIKRLDSSSLRQLFFEDNDISLMRLKKIQMKISRQESEGFGAFVNKCRDSLEVIDLHIYAFDGNTVFNIFNGLKEFKALKTLKIVFDYDLLINYSIVEQLKLISISCQHLKCLALRLKTKNLSQNLDIFNAIKHFKQLEKFEFRFNYGMKVIQTGNHFSSDALKDCHNLTHLQINGSKMFDTFFENISTNLPKLESLKVSNAKVTEVSFRELSKLKNLRTLCLHLFQIYSVGHIDKVIQNCKKISFIELLSYGLHVELDELEIEEIREEPETLPHFLKMDLK